MNMTDTSIWKSRKFWIMCIDVIVSVVAYFTGKYMDPEATKDVLFMIGALQPVILLVVGSITVQNVAGIKAQADNVDAALYNEAMTKSAATRNELASKAG
jgi:hypothetical protein